MSEYLYSQKQRVLHLDSRICFESVNSISNGRRYECIMLCFEQNIKSIIQEFHHYTTHNNFLAPEGMDYISTSIYNTSK